MGHGPVQGHAHVVDVATELAQPGGVGTQPVGLVGTVHQLGHRARMVGLQQRLLAAGLELEAGVVAHAVEQTVAWRIAAIDGHERAIDQRAQGVQHLPLVQAGVGRQALPQQGDQAEREATGEHRHAPEQGLLRRCQQLVAPVEGGHQGLVAVGHARAVASEQAESLIEALYHAGQAQQGHARGRQLDGQGQAIDPAAQLADQRHLVGQQRMAAVKRTHLVHEQSHRAMLQGLVHRGASRRDGQRPQPEDALAIDLQGHLAGDQQPHARRGLHHGAHQARDRLQHVLGVVQHQQNLQRAQGRGQAAQTICASDRQTQRLGHGRDRATRGVQAGQIDPGRAIGAVRAPAVGGGQGQRRFADAGRAHQGDERCRQQSVQGGQVALASPQALRLRGQRGQRLGLAGLRLRPAHGRQLQGRGLGRRRTCGWRRGCGSRRRRSTRFAQAQRQHKTVTPPRHGDDGARAQDLAQGRHLHLEVVFLDHQAGPDQLHQLCLGDQPAMALGQRDQQRHGAAAQGGGLPVQVEHALVHTERESVKTDAVWQGFPGRKDIFRGISGSLQDGPSGHPDNVQYSKETRHKRTAPKLSRAHWTARATMC